MSSKTKKRLKIIAVIILLIVAGVSIGIVIQSSINERENLAKQQELQSIYNSGSAAPSTSSQSEGVPAYAKPQFRELIEINPELVGWLEVGELSTPVVQTDNNEYYLKHDFYGKEDAHGTVFADTRNSLTEPQDNIILYGHNYQKSKQIFYEVERYKEIDYVQAHPIISFTTLAEKRDYLVFGLFVSNTELSQGDVFDYHNMLSFSTVQAMNDFIGEVKKRSLLTSDIAVNADDRLITLSTCGYDFAGERIVLMARLLREGETPETLASTVYGVNPSPQMPEIWTNLYGKKQ
ncbi:MAG: class B sortase [Angelakisella sp.]